MPNQTSTLSATSASMFVLTMGVVSLFSDMTYEGASSINGPYLGMLGASATAIGVISGVGAFLGYSLRFVAGFVSDKTGRYWLVTFVGYAISLLAVPALALAGNWPLAAALVVAGRVGVAIQAPTVESMLSYTTGRLGKGWVYGLNTALDQLGATVGPLLVALILALNGNYQTAYALLAIAALLALGTLAIARARFPHPAQLEDAPAAKPRAFSAAYWLFMLAGALVAAGLMSFELISYHLSKMKVVADDRIPLLFALAMGVAAVASLIFGRLFDRVGMPVVIVAYFVSALFAPFVFSESVLAVIFGMILWGVGCGAQDSLLKAIIAGLVPEGKRSRAFGLFYMGCGGGWLAGSVTAGLLYDDALPFMIAFSVIVQFLSLPLFFIANRIDHRRK